MTGGGGFVGRRLIALMADRHPEWDIDAPAAEPGARGSLDVCDAQGVAAWIRDGKPDFIVHLAALAAVTASVLDPRQAWNVNLQGTLNLVLATQDHAPDAYLLHVSSSEVYGASFNAGVALDESALLQPINPYAASKAAADILVRQAAAGGLAATIMRPFNHTGAGQAEAFAIPSFAVQIARIEAGLRPPVIFVGSLEEERDFLNVDDVADAYLLALEHRARPLAGAVFNVSSGLPVRMGDILDKLLALSAAPIRVETDPARLRTATIKQAIGDSRRLWEQLGWRPRTSLDATLQQVLSHARRAVGA